MCLSKVTRGPNPGGHGYGYKVVEEFENHRGALTNATRFDVNGDWNIDKGNHQIQTNVPPYLEYHSGFHLYKKLTDAQESWYPSVGKEIWRVEYRNVSTYGTQEDCAVVVARELKFAKLVSLPKREGWHNV